METKPLARFIDHTILKPDTLLTDSLRIAKETLTYGFASACIPPSHLKAVYQRFPEINLCTVISFPFGYDETIVKKVACREAIQNGASEVDLVINVSKVKSGDWDSVRYEMQLINDFVHSEDKIIKWIFETALLTTEEIIRLCTLCTETQADFAKTSTGFSSYGARKEDVQLMKDHLDNTVQIKASGGIKSSEEALEFIALGASRIGTSSGVQLIKDNAN